MLTDDELQALRWIEVSGDLYPVEFPVSDLFEEEQRLCDMELIRIVHSHPTTGTIAHLSITDMGRVVLRLMATC